MNATVDPIQQQMRPGLKSWIISGMKDTADQRRGALTGYREVCIRAVQTQLLQFALHVCHSVGVFARVLQCFSKVGRKLIPAPSDVT
jgi:hypothetical protein